MFRVIIAGSRGFNDYPLLCRWCDHMLMNFHPSQVVIVSGTANGADKLGERYARERGMHIKQYPADWSLGRKAGPIRNEIMAQNADACIAFYDGTSTGTASMIRLAKEYNLRLKVVQYK